MSNESDWGELDLEAMEERPKTLVDAVNPSYMQNNAASASFTSNHVKVSRPSHPSVTNSLDSEIANEIAPLDAFNYEAEMWFSMPLSHYERMQGLVPYVDCDSWFRKTEQVGLKDCATEQSYIGYDVVAEPDDTEKQHDDVDVIERAFSESFKCPKGVPAVVDAGIGTHLPIRIEMRQACGWKRGSMLRNNVFWSAPVQNVDSNYEILAPSDQYMQRRMEAKTRADMVRQQLGQSAPIDFDQVPVY